jgi:tetratricopeptide (TPR) repeat protein
MVHVKEFPSFAPQFQIHMSPLIRHFSLLLCLLLVICCPAPAVITSKVPQAAPAAHNFDSLAKRAAEARDADRLDEAVGLYKQALALRPKWAEGWWSLGTLEYDRNNFAAAARAFRQLLPLAPKDGTAHVMLGLCEFELGQDAPALKHIEEGKNLGVGTDPQLRKVTVYHEGLLLLRASRFESAQEVFGNLCKEGTQTDEVRQNLGLAVFRLTAKSSPAKDTPGFQVIARSGDAACLSAQKRYEEARQKLAALVDEYPEYPGIHYVYGRFLIEVNDVPAAVDQFQQEIKNNPGSVISRLEIAAAKYKLDSAAAIPYAEEAVRLNPHLPFAHYLLGLLYLDTDAYLKAIPELEIAQKAFPKEPKIYFALGSAYSRAGRKADAEKARAIFLRLNQAPADTSKPGY